MGRVQQMPLAERQQASRRIANQVIALPEYQKAGCVMAFSSMDIEPDTRGIITHAAAQGKTVLLPRCLKAPEMEALPWRGDAFMQPGPWGIMEPAALEDTESGKIPEPDLILVPCVAATKDGKRLGHGAGYYDWYLRNRNTVKVCLCFQTQLVESLPAEEHDILMDLIVYA